MKKNIQKEGNLPIKVTVRPYKGRSPTKSMGMCKDCSNDCGGSF